MKVYACKFKDAKTFGVKIPGLKSKYVFAVIYRHPCHSINAFIEALDENLQRINNKKVKSYEGHQYRLKFQ